MKFLTNTISCDGLGLKVFRTACDLTLPTVLFVNAVGMEATLLTRLAVIFRSAGYNFVTWELRGSPGPGLHLCDCKLETHAQDGLNILAELGVSRVTLAGWCTGASIALFLAERLGARVTALLLVDGAYLFDGVPGAPLGNAMYAMCNAIVANVAMAPHYHALTCPKGNEAAVLGLESDPALLRHVTMPYRQGVDALLRYAFAIHHACDYDPVMLCAKVTRPTLLTAGTGDLMVSYCNSEKASRLIESSVLMLYPGRSHYSLFTDIDELRNIITFANAANFGV